MLESILLVYLFLANPNLNEAIALARTDNHEQSELILQNIQPNPQNEDTYNFFRFLNNFRMNNKTKAEIYASRINDPMLPVRYQVLTALMREDLKQWKEDDIGDIARDMAHVKDRLTNNDSGRTTKKIQDEIVKKLDKMIKDLEEPPPDKNQGSSAQQKQNPTPSQPLPDSALPQDGGTGKVDVVKLKKVTEQWGSLPPRERQQVLQELTQGMSARHREAIENYFRNLAEAQNKKRKN